MLLESVFATSPVAQTEASSSILSDIRLKYAEIYPNAEGNSDLEKYYRTCSEIGKSLDPKEIKDLLKTVIAGGMKVSGQPDIDYIISPRHYANQMFRRDNVEEKEIDESMIISIAVLAEIAHDLEFNNYVINGKISSDNSFTYLGVKDKNKVSVPLPFRTVKK